LEILAIINFLLSNGTYHDFWVGVDNDVVYDCYCSTGLCVDFELSVMTRDRLTWLLAGGLVIAGALSAFWFRAPTEAEEQHLRTQFHLQPDVELTDIRVSRPSLKQNIYEIQGIVRFDPNQYARYTNNMHKSVWTSRTLFLNGESHGSAGVRLTPWQGLDQRQFFSFGSLSSHEVQRTTEGAALCFRMLSPVSAQAPQNDMVRPCRPSGAADERGYVVQGLLDTNSRTLHMLIRRYGPWPLLN
jgi:hypothetical protein